MGKDNEIKIKGVVTYRERIALMSGSKVIVTVEAISKQDVASDEVERYEIVTKSEQVPIPFEVVCVLAQIDEKNFYAVRARIEAPDGKLLFITNKITRVITEDAPTDGLKLLLVSAHR